MKQHILHIVLGLSIILLLTTCRRIKEKRDAERSFMLYFADSTGELQHYCFDQVYGIGNTPLPSCANYNEAIKLPLSIISNSSSFVFVKEDKRDTLTVSYSRFYKIGDREYTVFYTLKNIRSTFSHATTDCIPSISKYCRSNYGLHAVVFL